MADSRLEIVLSAKDITGKVFAGVATRAKRLASQVMSLQGAVLGLAGVGGFGLLVQSAFTLNDKLAKTSDKLGITTEALGGLRHAAELTGVASNTMDMALQRMVRRVAEAAGGTGEAKAAIRELGLDAKKLAALSPDQMFAAIADRMKQVTTQGERVRLAFKLFDSEGVAVVNTLRLGSAGLRDATNELEALGGTISRVDAAKIEAANDAMGKVRSAALGMGTTLAIELADPLETIATNTTDWVKANQGLIQQNVAEAIDTIANAVDKLARAFELMGKARAFAYKYYPPKLIYDTAKGPVGDFLDAGKENAKRNREEYLKQYPEYADSYYRTTDSGMGDLDIGQDSSGYVYKGAKPSPDPESNPDVQYIAGANELMDAHVDDWRAYQKVLAEVRAGWQAEGDGFFSGTELFDLGIGATEDVEKATGTMEDLVRDASWSMQNSFSSFFDTTSEGFLSLEGLAGSVAQSIQRVLADALSQQVVKSVFSLFSVASAQGNVFSGGHLVPFAQGGIVNRPTVFPFASGIGLMGEAGPEAIMPLTRTPGGDLGVKSQGGGGGTTNIYIQAMDTKSFQDKLRQEGAGVITSVVGRDIMYNGGTRSVMIGSM